VLLLPVRDGCRRRLLQRLQEVVRLQKETCSDKSEARQQQKQSCTKKISGS
jgi:hypothetical protein